MLNMNTPVLLCSPEFIQHLDHTIYLWSGGIVDGISTTVWGMLDMSWVDPIAKSNWERFKEAHQKTHNTQPYDGSFLHVSQVWVSQWILQLQLETNLRYSHLMLRSSQEVKNVAHVRALSVQTILTYKWKFVLLKRVGSGDWEKWLLEFPGWFVLAEEYNNNNWDLEKIAKQKITDDIWESTITQGKLSIFGYYAYPRILEVTILFQREITDDEANSLGEKCMLNEDSEKLDKEKIHIPSYLAMLAMRKR